MEATSKRDAIIDVVVRALYSLYDEGDLDRSTISVMETRRQVARALDEDTRGDDEMLPTEDVARRFASSDPDSSEEMQHLAGVFPRLNAFMQDFCGAM